MTVVILKQKHDHPSGIVIKYRSFLLVFALCFDFISMMTSNDKIIISMVVGTINELARFYFSVSILSQDPGKL